MDPNQPHSGRSILSAFALVAAFTFAAALGNSLVTSLLWRTGTDFVNCLFCGILIAQPCVLSIWCGAVKQRLISRVSLSMGILFVLFFIYLLTMRALDKFPLEVPIVCGGIVIALSLMIQLPLILLRRSTNTALSRGTPEQTIASEHQFGIKHLMIATTIVALLTVLAQAVFANLGFQGDTPWVEIVTFLVSIAVLTWAICLLSVGLVFFDRIRIAAGILLGLAVFLGPIVVYGILSNTVKGFNLADVLANTLVYAISLAVTITVVLVCFYTIGYRMNPQTTRA